MEFNAHNVSRIPAQSKGCSRELLPWTPQDGAKGLPGQPWKEPGQGVAFSESVIWTSPGFGPLCSAGLVQMGLW